MATRIERQETSKNELAERLAAMETAISKIAEHVQAQSAFNASAANSINCLENQMRVHQDNFQEVARILQTHEQHIIYNGVASQEMAQYINALAQDSEKNRAWIGAMMRESNAQAQVLLQHKMAQQVLAEVIKVMMSHQQNQQQTGVTTTGPIVTEVEEDGAVLDFLGGQNQTSGPPITRIGQMTIKPPRSPRRKNGPKGN